MPLQQWNLLASLGEYYRPFIYSRRGTKLVFSFMKVMGFIKVVLVQGDVFCLMHFRVCFTNSDEALWCEFFLLIHKFLLYCLSF